MTFPWSTVGPGFGGSSADHGVSLGALLDGSGEHNSSEAEAVLTLTSPAFRILASFCFLTFPGAATATAVW